MRPLVHQLSVQVLRKTENLAEVREDVENVNAHTKKTISDYQKNRRNIR
jgi:hypothetical protein